jgi:imidazolonepropionase-like amidohydrolase
MIPGQLDLMLLKPELKIGDVYEEGIGMQIQFEESSGVYPSTVMGIMARLEQLMMDADAMNQQQAYAASQPTQMSAPPNDPVLEALYPVMEKELRVFFKADSKEMIERVFKLQDALGFDIVLVSGMEAYKVANELNKRDIPVLASINFPEKPKWKKDEDDEEDEDKDKEKEDEEDDEKEEVEEVEVTEEMQVYRDKRWEAYQKRYKNIKSLMDAGVEVGFASADLELKDMSGRMKDWKEYGDITEKEMLKVMTSNTAAILDSGQTLGGLQEGKVAGFTVMTKPFTEKEAKALYSVSGGELHDLEVEED